VNGRKRGVKRREGIKGEISKDGMDGDLLRK
jgi:hypothetical protein